MSDEHEIDLAASVHATVTDMDVMCECHEGQITTAVLVILTAPDGREFGIAINEDEAANLIRQIANAREFAIKANFGRHANPQATA